MSKKIAVIFPGVGYHVDKPLLYYSKKLAAQNGYEIKEVPYGKFPKGVKGSREKMEKAFFSALEQAGEILKDIDFSEYEDVLFISKSVGTAVASAYAGKHGLNTRNIYYTPVEASFQFMKQPGIAFTGTADTWVTFDAVERGCRERGFPLYVTEDGNHSLETGDVRRDLENLQTIMKITEEYISGRRGLEVMIRHADMDDLEQIAALEALCFPEAEAGKREDFEKRLRVFPEHFWLLEEDGEIVSMVNGMVSNSRHLLDEMFENAGLHEENGAWQMIFGVETRPDRQGRGYMDKLMRKVIRDVKKQGRKGLVLTCKEGRISFYERFGFVNEGRSGSEHGGAQWFEMRLEF